MNWLDNMIRIALIMLCFVVGPTVMGARIHLASLIQPVIYNGYRLTQHNQGRFGLFRDGDPNKSATDAQNPMEPQASDQFGSVSATVQMNNTSHLNILLPGLYVPHQIVQTLVNRLVSLVHVLPRMPRLKPRHLCGGFVIDSHWILTAAHCVANYISHVDRLKFAQISSKENKFFHPSDKLSSISAIHMHPDFEIFSPFSPDLALLKTSLSIDHPTLEKLADHSIHLDDGSGTGLGSGAFGQMVCLIAGLGRLEYGSVQHQNPENYLHVGSVHLNSCSRLWDALEHSGQLDPFESECTNHVDSQCSGRFLCAGGKQLDGDTCQGDSGGPLICRPKQPNNDLDPETKNWFLTGIASSGIGCGLEQIPAIYTPVNNYRDWIASVLDRW